MVEKFRFFFLKFRQFCYNNDINQSQVSFNQRKYCPTTPQATTIKTPTIEFNESPDDPHQNSTIVQLHFITRYTQAHGILQYGLMRLAKSENMPGSDIHICLLLHQGSIYEIGDFSACCFYKSLFLLLSTNVNRFATSNIISLKDSMVLPPLKLHFFFFLLHPHTSSHRRSPVRINLLTK